MSLEMDSSQYNRLKLVFPSFIDTSGQVHMIIDGVDVLVRPNHGKQEESEKEENDKIIESLSSGSG